MDLSVKARSKILVFNVEAFRVEARIKVCVRLSRLLAFECTLNHCTFIHSFKDFNKFVLKDNQGQE